MLCLASDTDPAWVHAALKDPAALLSDHAQCEKKAALSALSLTQAFAHDTEVVTELAAFAREELEHFEACCQHLLKRGWALERGGKDPYAAQLINAAAADVTHHLVDRLLIAALIEARSTERLKILSEHHPDAELAAFCRELMATEAGHYMFFVRLAGRVSDPEFAKVRLTELAKREAEIVAGLPHLPRVH
ncbi:MAG: tRNA isopentenyl-2-thiomethyl-A-37 hydroxylase MiaE [Myxococcota bacterium]|nr:tRNA isopentenyl-2-thiomethyl-A-37 hydroxylase MiaE [Myxococcota bacterium]